MPDDRDDSRRNEARQQRRAEALRQNLKKRKAQLRGRAAASEPDQDAATDTAAER